MRGRKTRREGRWDILSDIHDMLGTHVTGGRGG